MTRLVSRKKGGLKRQQLQNNHPLFVWQYQGKSEQTVIVKEVYRFTQMFGKAALIHR